MAMAHPQPAAPAGRPAAPPQPLARRLSPLSWLPRGSKGRAPAASEAPSAAVAARPPPEAPVPQKATSSAFAWLPGSTKPLENPSSAAAASEPARVTERPGGDVVTVEPVQRPQPATASAHGGLVADEALRGGGTPMLLALGAAAAMASAFEPLFRVGRRTEGACSVLLLCLAGGFAVSVRLCAHHGSGQTLPVRVGCAPVLLALCLCSVCASAVLAGSGRVCRWLALMSL